MPTLLAIFSFCDCLVVYVCLFRWCKGLDVDLIVLVPEFIYLLFRELGALSEYSEFHNTLISLLRFRESSY